ncbi:hypothetical protein CBR_g36557 [Chara braunii]|uniref:Uncharacterized protein n=1 Tax=Chara braunii TaxID=69332 RepID=A0A388JZ59_CHABU|nr:hypothetical protein CBR_g36557 [Chara braunii]|eukprot:GBG63072.1 hypothetical protein CBR_g36557 [Chara braunii]
MNATCTSMEALLAGGPASHCFTTAANSNRIDKSCRSRACPLSSRWTNRGIPGAEEEVVTRLKRAIHLHPPSSHSHSHSHNHNHNHNHSRLSRGQCRDAVVAFALFGGGGKPKSQQGDPECEQSETSMDTADLEQAHLDRDSGGESEMSEAGDRETDLRSWNRPGEIQRYHRAAKPVEEGPEANSRQWTPRGCGTKKDSLPRMQTWKTIRRTNKMIIKSSSGRLRKTPAMNDT